MHEGIFLHEGNNVFAPILLLDGLRPQLSAVRTSPQYAHARCLLNVLIHTLTANVESVLATRSRKFSVTKDSESTTMTFWHLEKAVGALKDPVTKPSDKP